MNLGDDDMSKIYIIKINILYISQLNQINHIEFLLKLTLIHQNAIN